MPVAGFSPFRSTRSSTLNEPFIGSAVSERLVTRALNVFPGKASSVTMALSPRAMLAHSASLTPVRSIQWLLPDTWFIKNTGMPGPAISPALISFFTTKPLAGATILAYCLLKLAADKPCFAISNPVLAFCNCSSVATLSWKRL